jgi:hypothetical protein
LIVSKISDGGVSAGESIIGDNPGLVNMFKIPTKRLISLPSKEQ